MHHISDSHEWHLWGEGDQSFTIALPIILYSNSFHFFMSSAFRHDENAKHIVTSKESKFVNLHGKIYQLDSGETELVFDQEHQLLNASIPLDFSITKNVASMLIGLVLLLLVFIISGFKAKKNKGAPSGILSFLEPIVLFVRDDIVNLISENNTTSFYLPINFIFFILINNLLGLLPGSANVTGNIAITLVLSCITLIVTNLSEINLTGGTFLILEFL